MKMHSRLSHYACMAVAAPTSTVVLTTIGSASEARGDILSSFTSVDVDLDNGARLFSQDDWSINAVIESRTDPVIHYAGFRKGGGWVGLNINDDVTHGQDFGSYSFLSSWWGGPDWKDHATVRYDVGNSHLTSHYLPMGTNVVVGVAFAAGGYITEWGERKDCYFGWIDYSLSITDGDFSFTINSWAFNDVLNEGIVIGQAAAVGGAVPGLGGLGALALGAVGLRHRRQRSL